MLRFFAARAGWFVVASWVLLPTTIVVGTAVGIGAGISTTYHPLHQGAPIHRFVLQAVNFALAVSFIAAIASSVLLVLKFRLAASAVVVGCWSVFLIGATGARLLVKPGPEHFQRYVGTERFSVPWRYRPGGEDRPNRVGFYVHLCLSNLRGAYDENCDARQFMIYPSDRGFTLIFDERFWRTRLSEMRIGQVRNGHQSYSYTPAPDTGITPKQYLARYDEAGKLARLVVCGDGFRWCQHHALVRNYVLSYYADESTLPEWEMMDRKLADLVDSWRVP